MCGHDGIIGWKPPWKTGGVRFPLDTPPGRRHIFQEDLRGKVMDLGRLIGRFGVVTPDRLAKYRQALPKEWVGDGIVADRILCYIGQLRDQIGEAVHMLEEALK